MHLADDPYHSDLNPNAVKAFYESFLQTSSNFQFFYKISQNFDSFLIREMNSSLRAEIKCTYFPRSLNNGEKYNLYVKDIRDGCKLGDIRDDNRNYPDLAIFGKNELSDFKFPLNCEDIDNISFLVYLGSDNCYVIDFLENKHLSLELIPQQSYELSEGMVFSIAQSMHFYIKSISFPDSNNLANSIMKVEYLDGKYEGITLVLNTLKADGNPQTTFSLGRGGNGFIDFYCDFNSKVSSNHLRFDFNENNNT